MNLEALSALTPYATFFLAVIIGIIGWFLKWMINSSHRQYGELHRQIRHLGVEIKDLEKSRQADQKYMYEQFVNKEAYIQTLEKTESLIRRIFDQLNDMSRSVHQIIGALHARDNDSSD